MRNWWKHGRNNKETFIEQKVLIHADLAYPIFFKDKKYKLPQRITKITINEKDSDIHIDKETGKKYLGIRLNSLGWFIYIEAKRISYAKEKLCENRL